jgi:hypothetical protein
MAFNRTVQLVKSTAVEAVMVFADFTGAGAAAPTVSASTVLLPKDNFASSIDLTDTTITRNGAGDYTFLFPQSPATVLNVSAGARGATDLAATVSTWSISDGRLSVTVKTWTPAGVATDLADGTDFLRVAIVGNLSTT